MSDEEELIHCVVTGEIYDHDRIRDEMERQGFTFKSKSDSELVVQLWVNPSMFWSPVQLLSFRYKRDGINCVANLRGEFAFVLYDTKRRQIFAARDRFGIKPLYYTVSNDRILFASEMKAFMGLGWKAEWDLDSIVHSGDIGDDRTVFNGVRKVFHPHHSCFEFGPTNILSVVCGPLCDLCGFWLYQDREILGSVLSRRRRSSNFKC